MTDERKALVEELRRDALENLEPATRRYKLLLRAADFISTSPQGERDKALEEAADRAEPATERCNCNICEVRREVAAEIRSLKSTTADKTDRKE